MSEHQALTQVHAAVQWAAILSAVGLVLIAGVALALWIEHNRKRGDD